MSERIFFVMRVHLLALLCLAAVSVAGCHHGPQDGLTKYPVHGKVLVNGAPHAGIVIRCVQRGQVDTKSNARFPVGVTDEKGEFRLSTNGDKDGAVAGEYTVIFVWPERNESPPGDLFQGAYANLDTSSFRATVNAGENELATFELELKNGKPTGPAPASPLRNPDR